MRAVSRERRPVHDSSSSVVTSGRHASREGLAGGASTWWSSDRWAGPLLIVGAVALVVHLALRIWLLTRGNFYWDDLVLVGRASTHSLWSWSYLGHDHDGHFMPAAFLVAGVCTHLAPLSWPLAAASLLIGQLLAAAAVARMLVVIAGRVCPAVLAAWLFFLFTPMTVPAFAWWAAGLNSLPMQAGLAWIIADAVLVARGRRTATPWMIVSSVAILLVACAFFEKSLLIVPAAIAFAVLATPDRRAAVRR